jgi:hypothetical protein
MSCWRLPGRSPTPKGRRPTATGPLAAPHLPRRCRCRGTPRWANRVATMPWVAPGSCEAASASFRGALDRKGGLRAVWVGGGVPYSASLAVSSGRRSVAIAPRLVLPRAVIGAPPGWASFVHALASPVVDLKLRRPAGRLGQGRYANRQLTVVRPGECVSYHSFVFEPARADEQVERRLIADAGQLAVADLDAVEHRLAEQPTGPAAGPSGRPAAVGGRPQGGLSTARLTAPASDVPSMKGRSAAVGTVAKRGCAARGGADRGERWPTMLGWSDEPGRWPRA